MDDAGPKEPNYWTRLKSLFHKNKETDESDVIEKEIMSMVNEGHEQGVLQASEAEMIHNIFEFTDKEARDIMTHRSAVVSIEATTTLKEAVAFMLHGKNSRYPVYIENIDHIIGIIHLKDACRALEDMPELADKMIKSCKGVIREAHFIPETRSINTLFRNMKIKKTHLAIVIDEYGQTSGIVTMEDILEEIVGNILDEYDEEDARFKKRGQDSYEIEGLTPLDDISQMLSIDFSKEEYETISGLMIARMGRIPKDGEHFEMDFGAFHFKALNVKDKVIRRVLVTKQKQKPEGED